VRARLRAARQVQAARFAGSPRLSCNAAMRPAEVRARCAVDPAAQPLLRAAMQRLQLSARAFHRLFKRARTIADLASAEQIAAPTWPRRSSTARARGPRRDATEAHQCACYDVSRGCPRPACGQTAAYDGTRSRYDRSEDH
jgi:Magnesium chelatase, subunit ChlI C-terminal